MPTITGFVSLPDDTTRVPGTLTAVIESPRGDGLASGSDVGEVLAGPVASTDTGSGLSLVVPTGWVTLTFRSTGIHNGKQVVLGPWRHNVTTNVTIKEILAAQPSGAPITPSQYEQLVTMIESVEGGTGGGGVTDHGALTGLGDDDHPHYLNQARGDARYVQPSGLPAVPAPSDGSPRTHGTAEPGTGTAYARWDHRHPMPSAGDVGAATPADVSTASTADRARANHTGSQAQSTVTNLTTDLAGKQPLDSDLTAIAALSTTTYGRSLLTLADAAAARTALGIAPVPYLWSGNPTVSATSTAYVTVAQTLVSARMRTTTAPVGSALTAILQRSTNGGTSWTDLVTLTIAAGSTTEAVQSVTTALGAGDLLRLNVTSIGSTTAATGVSVEVYPA